jgi:hypothetical protein
MNCRISYQFRQLAARPQTLFLTAAGLEDSYTMHHIL